MECPMCKTALHKDSLHQNQEKNGDLAVHIVFKCPNPQCSAYGYKKENKNI